MRKLLVITGGTKGIGRAIIEKFIVNGFDVATCARKQSDLDSLKNTLGGDRNIFTFQADVSDRIQAQSFCEFVQGLGRPVDVLVNNAGYFVPGEISTEPEGNLEAMMQANLYSAYHVTRSFVHAMKEQRNGHIVNICSIASIKAYANGGSYAITKFAMLGMSKCLREELKEYGIRVTAVMPGATKTASWDGVDMPEERFMKVEDVADIIYASYTLSSRSVVEEVIIRPQLGDI
ncbi:MAG: SDR family oxidoreductase [Cyclobacteriaceae bacterium]|nr:SDR family oxidoreductase [Cyclobacteriaceae bacterium]